MERLPSVMHVRVEGELCSGCGNCVQTVPEVFVHVDGVARVTTEDGWIANDGEVVVVGCRGPLGSDFIDRVYEAAENCPGEIIEIEYMDVPIIPEAEAD